MILRSPGLEYDDRVRKECLSLSQDSDVHLFVNLGANVAEEGVTSYGIPYTAVRLESRERISPGRMLLAKALEFYLKLAPALRSYDVLWAHEESTFLFPLLTPVRERVWDLHELPDLFDRPLLRTLFRIIERRCRYVIHANGFRIRHLRERRLATEETRHRTVRNFPDQDFIRSELLPTGFHEVKRWLGSDPYVYLQSISTPDRFPFNTLAALLRTTTLKAVVVGRPADEDLVERLRAEAGDEFDARVRFVGMLQQMATPAYIRTALFSMVFYDATRPNERYCEPNRFFQALVLGVPVITGNNEPMAEVIETHECGVAIPSDGRHLTEVVSGIITLMSGLEQYRANARKVAAHFCWNPESVQALARGCSPGAGQQPELSQNSLI